MGGMKAGFNCCLQWPYYFIKTNYPVKQATAASFQHNREEMGLPGTVRLNGIDRGPGPLIRLRRAAFYPSSRKERLAPNLNVHMCVSLLDVSGGFVNKFSTWLYFLTDSTCAGKE